MGELVRFGVSIDSELLRRFDRVIDRKGYANRSEALRDLIRERLISADLEDGASPTVATVTLVYDHDASDVTRRLTELQHSHLGLVVSSLHVHLDAHDCLEVLVLKGSAKRIGEVADRLISTRHVKHGKLAIGTTGKQMP